MGSAFGSNAKGRRTARVLASAVVALIATGFAAVTVDASALGSLVTEHFVAVPTADLPAGTTYDDATCPSDIRCYVVGGNAGGGVITTTDNDGRTWATTTLPSTTGLTDFSISCPAASVCYVGGTDYTGDTTLLATHDAGARWTVGSVPADQIVTSIGCGACEHVHRRREQQPVAGDEHRPHHPRWRGDLDGTRSGVRTTWQQSAAWTRGIASRPVPAPGSPRIWVRAGGTSHHRLGHRISTARSAASTTA